MTDAMKSKVETGEDFVALLRCLSRHFVRLGPDAPEVDDVLLRWAAALPDQAPDPGWAGLADQLLGALAAPSAGLADPVPLGSEPPVATAGELCTLLPALAADYARDRAWSADRRARGLWAGDGGGWASSSIAGFLESWESWLGSSLSTELSGVPPIEPVSWASVAWQLGAARVYE
ncbi:hypothetical protein OG239_43100 (plasmid) [Streptomyces sp. NBC_00868]|uniref:hypothetical protein n=1 Tax=Streptomyces sp. NBC_00868 TaxID=2903683 RepID=UPI003862EAA9|nr:hypothetical protein OG239_43100 [Streptomyces sp. NBC_00868]